MKTVQQIEQKDKTQNSSTLPVGLVCFRVPLPVRRELRRMSFETDVTMQDLGTRALTEFVERSRKG